MDIDEAITLTQRHLAQEGETMGDLIGHFRSKVSPVLVGEPQWKRIVECAGGLPITLGALPFGFELPLHDRRPQADLGVSLASGTATAEFFRAAEGDETAGIVTRLFSQMDATNSRLREIVGPKLMLEFDIGSAGEGERPLPGVFLRPGERPIVGASGQVDDVNVVVDALVSGVGWASNGAERRQVQRAYLAQPRDTRLDSFGVFPSRERAIRLAVMGFKSQRETCTYLEEAGWPGDLAAVRGVMSRFRQRANIVRSGANIDVREDGLGPTLGLTLIVKQRYTNDSRYWLDGLTDWDPFLGALAEEEIVAPDKLAALADWASTPTPIFGKAGRYVLLRGIHHIKLVITDGALRQAKAYVFLVLSAAVT